MRGSSGIIENTGCHCNSWLMIAVFDAILIADRWLPLHLSGSACHFRENKRKNTSPCYVSKIAVVFSAEVAELEVKSK